MGDQRENFTNRARKFYELITKWYGIAGFFPREVEHHCLRGVYGDTFYRLDCFTWTRY